MQCPRCGGQTYALTFLGIRVRQMRCPEGHWLSQTVVGVKELRRLAASGYGRAAAVHSTPRRTR